jgi:preprotein translocase subunit SecF
MSEKNNLEITPEAETFLSGFSNLFQNKYFWFVMVFMIAIIIGVYYYFTYLKTNIKEEKNIQDTKQISNESYQQKLMDEELRQKVLQQQMMQQQMMQQQMMQQQMMQQMQQPKKPKIKHPEPILEEVEIPELEEENENVREQKLTQEEMLMLRQKLESN